MRLTVFATAAVSSAVALVGFAGVANASATIDLIWIDVTDTACTNDGRRDCPQLGTLTSSVVVADNITLAVIVTAGPGGLGVAGVSVDYRDTLPVLSVSAFSRLSTTGPLPYLPGNLGDPNNDTVGWVQNINAGCCFGLGGIGLPAGATAYLGTVTFRKDLIVNGTFEIVVGIDGPDGTDGVLGLDPFGADISSTTTFNSAFMCEGAVSCPTPIPTPTSTPIPTPTATPTPAPFDCLCEVTNINPNTLNLNKVSTGGKQSSETRRMNVQIRAVDAPGATCDLGETSGPVKINLRMVDDDGDVLIDSAKIAVCENGGQKQMVRNVFIQPKNCKDSAVPDGTSSGFITATGSAFGSPDYVELLNINCNE